MRKNKHKKQNKENQVSDAGQCTKWNATNTLYTTLRRFKLSYLLR